MKKLDILGSKVQIKLLRPKDETDAAIWLPEKNQIHIDPNIGDKYYYAVHEITHAFLERIGVTHTNVGDNLEEIICHTNATVMSENAVKLWQLFNKLERKKV
jgi:hypothetical protein